MSRFAWPFTLGLLLAVGSAAVAPPNALAAEEGSYQKRKAAVLEKSGPYMHVVREGLDDLGRFDFVPVAATPDEPLSSFLAKVRAAGPGDAPLYTFVPSYAFGSTDYTEPKSETVKESNGRIKTTIYAYVQVPFTYNVEIYDARTGALVKRLSTTDRLQRRFETIYDQRDSDRDVGYKQGLLLGRLMAELRRPPQEAFADLAHGHMGSLRSWLQGELRRMEEFQLRARVTGWDAGRDRVFIDMGKNFKIGLNGGFKLVRDGRELGYMRVTRTDQNASDLMPVFLDTVLQRGDQMVEYPKGNTYLMLKGGLAWLGGPAAVGGLSLEGDFAPWWGGTDFFGTFDASGVKALEVGGAMVELGLLKRFYWRRWGLSLGLKPGVALLNGANSTKVASPFGATAVTGLNCYLTPDLVASLDLGFAAYTPVQQKDGLGDGKFVQPFGPTAKLGLSLVF